MQGEAEAFPVSFNHIFFQLFPVDLHGTDRIFILVWFFQIGIVFADRTVAHLIVAGEGKHVTVVFFSHPFPKGQIHLSGHRLGHKVHPQGQFLIFLQIIQYFIKGIEVIKTHLLDRCDTSGIHHLHIVLKLRGNEVMISQNIREDLHIGFRIAALRRKAKDLHRLCVHRAAFAAFHK